jgi:energy-coupling factor transporter ATP-binding protein EcfA2
MMVSSNTWPRGAEWRRWDLHVHTPASLLGTSFVGVQWDDYVDALEEAAQRHKIAVIGVTDYMSIDGYEKLRALQNDATKPRLPSVLLLPNIEFRSMPSTKTGQALNLHLLVNVSDPLHVDKIKKSLRNLKYSYNHQQYGCIRDELIDFARQQDPSLLDDTSAYRFGVAQFKPSQTDIFGWLDNDKWLTDNSAVGIANGNDGISGLPLDNFAATRDELLRRSHFIFSGNPADRQHYLGLKAGISAASIRNQYGTLKPCFHGSDAHEIAKLFEPDQKVAQEKRYCWIKADPSFLGLLQAIKEPDSRTFIGEMPPKLVEVAGHKRYFIDRVEVAKVPGCVYADKWLDGCSVPLNTDLVAIIGNKGSGKSALADVIALLGHSHRNNHFTFLKRERFRGKSGIPAKHFVGKLVWHDSSSENQNLNDDAAADKVELVRYIPQGHFEELCNEHVSGKSNAFERELRAVIFSHAGESIRLGALDFDQLIEQQERSYRDQLADYRKDLNLLNQGISSIEDQLQPEIRRNLNEQLSLLKKQIQEHEALRPADVAKPTDELTPEQAQAAAELDTVSTSIKSLDDRVVTHSTIQSSYAAKIKALQNIRERIRLLRRSSEQFELEASKDFQTLGVDPSSVVKISIDETPLEVIEKTLPALQAELALEISNDSIARTKLQETQYLLKAKLNAPQLAYQQGQNALAEWTSRLTELNGTPEQPETLEGLNARIAQLDGLPELLKQRRERRSELAGEIFDILDTQRKARELLFKPVQDLIQGNSLIRDEYKLQFQATLGGTSESLAAPLFTLIKQNSKSFRGEDESLSTVKRIADKYDFNSREDVVKFVGDLHDEIQSAAGGTGGSVGIASILRRDKAAKDKTAGDVYDLLYSLSFLEPRYTLLFQDTQIEQLSPGQRGALLLIFYLLVDKGRTPIILDQPEENLDNETVVSLLVPVLSEAKKKRQIIMATHNPNLAVVCDAEQVIYSSFERKSGSTITYVSGAIENPEINEHVVDVLEGTMPAFQNRREKYQEPYAK